MLLGEKSELQSGTRITEAVHAQVSRGGVRRLGGHDKCAIREKKSNVKVKFLPFRVLKMVKETRRAEMREQVEKKGELIMQREKGERRSRTAVPEGRTVCKLQERLHGSPRL